MCWNFCAKLVVEWSDNMQQYLQLCQDVLAKGQTRTDRTNTGTISIFGYQSRYDLTAGFPLLTTKKVNFKAVALELLWFLSGSTNIQPLVKENVRIWNEWPYERYKLSPDYQGETLAEYVERIKIDDVFALKHGDLGPVYGKQWRNFQGVDQISELIKGLKTNPYSRRHIVNAYNPAELTNMALPPCHAFFQFYVSADGKRLSCQLYQRSADIFLGVPFNIASYALLLMMVAEVTGYEPYEFVHTLGDAHIYLNHLDQINLQLSREPRPLPTLKFKRSVSDIFEFTYEDFELIGYDPHPYIPGAIAV